MTDKDTISIPVSGEKPDLILEQIQRMKEDAVAWKEGRVWSLIYKADEEHDNHMNDANKDLFSANHLNPLAFKSLHRMEQEVVRMTSNMLHGN